MYKVKLEVFEGPLDLLLYLIKKDEVNIYDIPIARITDEYLEYIELMKMLDINIASEFIVMAATLMQIKSKMLLPVEERVPEEEEEVDPREELVRQLLEYKKFKEAAVQLEELELKRAEVFTRAPEEDSFDNENGDEPFFEASLFDLIAAFSEALKGVSKEEFQEIIKDEFTVEEKVHEILQLLKQESRIFFSNLFHGAKNKLEIIARFLALLELIRLKLVLVRQHAEFGEIEIVKR